MNINRREHHIVVDTLGSGAQDHRPFDRHPGMAHLRGAIQTALVGGVAAAAAYALARLVSGLGA